MVIVCKTGVGVELTLRAASRCATDRLTLNHPGGCLGYPITTMESLAAQSGLGWNAASGG